MGDDVAKTLAAIQAQAREQKSVSTAEAALAVSETPNVSSYTVFGVDVSHHDGAIDWVKVRKSGIAFAYIKATEGIDFPNDDATRAWFRTNWRDSSRAGVIRGAYHFYNFCRKGSDEAAKQAANFIKSVPTAELGALPPVLDLEESKDCSDTDMPGRDAFRKDLAVFVAKISKAYRQTPVMYVNYSIYKKYFLGAGDRYRLWFTDAVHRAPLLPGAAPWAIWQYDYRGRIPGILGRVDRDAFNGTLEMLSAMTRRLPDAPAQSPSSLLIADLP